MEKTAEVSDMRQELRKLKVGVERRVKVVFREGCGGWRARR
jgi:hypothetical protein